MKYKEVKEYYMDDRIKRQYFLDESGKQWGEYRSYYGNGQVLRHCFRLDDCACYEVKVLNDDGSLYHHYLNDGKGTELATVVEHGEPSIHSDEQLIEIAKEHNLPLLSELPKAEEEVTLWNIKHPDMPCLPITTD